MVKKKIVKYILAIIVTAIFSAAAYSNNSFATVTIRKTQPDNSTWTMISGTNIVLDTSKISLWQAYKNNKYTITGNTSSDFIKFVENNHQLSDGTHLVYSSWDSSNKGVILAWRRNGAFGSSHTTYNVNRTISLNFEKAARGLDGQYYDVKITIDNMKIRTGSKTTSKKYVPLISSGTGAGINFGAFSFQYNTFTHGTSYDVRVRLYRAGTDDLIPVGNSMIWGFSDVDISDRITGSKQHSYHHSNYPWAEHVVLKKGYGVKQSATSNERNVTLYVSQHTQLGTWIDTAKTPDWIHVYHNWNEQGSSNTDDSTTKFVFAMDPNDFQYTWAGSECSTAFAATSGTMYTGHTEVYSNTIKDSNKLEENKVHTIKAASKTLAYYHWIHRNGQGPTSDNEEYFIKTGTDSGPAKGSATNHKSYSSTKNHDTPVYDENVSGNPFTVNLTPGQKKIIWQELHYQLSNIDDSLFPYVDKTCTLVTPNVDGRVCVGLYRPQAKFSGTVGSKIIPDGGSEYKTPSTSEQGTEITTSDGSFKIRFTAAIERVSDEAGDTATTPYSIVQRLGSKNGSDVNGTRIPSSGKNDTKGLRVGEKDEVRAASDNYTYTSKLKYGESRTICAVMDYKSVVNASAAGGGTDDTKSSCVKVWRKPKKCDMNGNYDFGVHNGRNLGRIGVVNHSYPGSTDSYKYTDSSPDSFTQANGYTVERSIWARPGDSIRFIEESCAGGQYAVNNTSTLNNTTYKTEYKNTGTLENAAGSISSSTGYLFGEKLSGKLSETPLKYKNTHTYKSTNTGNIFPVGDHVELEEESPSTTSNTTYNRDTYNTTSYSCEKLNDSSFVPNHYQIAGKASATETGCHAYSKTAVASDVGHIIKHSMSWNYLHVTNSVANGTFENNKTFTANAMVKIPYNYNIQPAISSSTESHVVYLGSTNTFNAELFVSPRKNSVFGETETNNTYATITKKTNVSFEYYFIINGVKQGATVIKSNRKTGASDNRIRLNPNGNFNGTVNVGASVENGGYKYASKDIHIDDSILSVGDKVCAHISVSPRDSHNSYMTETVTGAGTNNVALKEDGSGTEDRTTCYTVAKRPTMSVESSNAFAGGNRGFVTGKYNKRFAGDNTEYIFGSWSEYGVFGKVDLSNGRGIASGATFGYTTKNDGVTKNQSRVNSGTNLAKSDQLHGGNVCVYSTHTYTNANCGVAGAGTIGTKLGENAANEFRKLISEKYTVDDDSKQSRPKDSIPYPGGNYTWSGGNPSDYGYVKPSTGVQYANLRVWLDDEVDKDGVNLTYTKGNGYIGSGNDSTPYTLRTSHNLTGGSTASYSFTRVIQVDGTLVIDADIKTGASGNDDPNLNYLTQVSQAVILAKNVEITSRVKQIDAIIIADEINTCAYNSVSDFANGKKAGIGAETGTTIDSTKCNNPITFRGPVSTRKITLNRTYGAGKGQDSIKRAEIFELNSYNYLWSFNQMSRYSQAVTVYQRELPPRY